MTRKKKTMDGNQATAHVAYAYSEVAAIYPITPSSTMAEYTDEWSAEGRENIFGKTVKVAQLQSEAGAAGTVHGSLIAGALTTTFTASQGLLLMIPNLYKIAGEQLPGVFHVAARTIATHALSIFGDHSDIYACRQIGVCMFSSSSVQEVMDLTPVSHLSAIAGHLPFINFFDGFRTSHEMQKIEVWDYEDLKEMADMEEIRSFWQNALTPDHARLMGSAQNPDIYFQAREASNPVYDRMPSIVEASLSKINQRLGTHYGLFDYYGVPDASHVIIAMGSVCETIEEVIDYLHLTEPEGKYGLIKVHLYRPFSSRHLLEALPASVRQITVLDRTKEPGSVGEPLFLDVTAALKGSVFSQIPIYSGRYGLSSKNTAPNQIAAVFHNREKMRFTIGITDDVTQLSLIAPPAFHTAHEDTISCKFWGLGGDGTVSANKSSVKIIGNHTDRYVQAYFDYDSKKSRGLTVSHLRFGTTPIRSAYLIDRADLVACHNPVYLHKYHMAEELKDGGIFLLNCYWKEKELEKYIPGQVKRYLARHKIRFYIIDAIRIGKEIGLNNKISTILQAAFFRLSGILPLKEASRLMKEAAKVSYGKKGEKILQMNYTAIDRGLQEVMEVSVPEHWKDADEACFDQKLLPDRPDILAYVENLQKKINAQEGNSLPVSAFLPYADGSTPPGASAHERRNVNTEVPVWLPENCIQCNRCSYVCPHAVIRPCVMNEEEQQSAPAGMRTLPMMGMEGYTFSITVSEVDCTGCGSCAGVCPGKQGKKALAMQPVNEHQERQQYFDYNKSLPPKPEVLAKFRESTIKGSQFKQPMLEFHGACAGCGETPYAILATQLFGERMYIANATGCSSIWANSSPSASYTCNARGQGPAWANSLFEDAAEFGYGMLLAQEVHDNEMHDNEVHDNEMHENKMHDNGRTRKSVWIFGGDGWAYDIGFGGLDHVLASGRNINVLVFDTEVYSNTGGQASKATPAGSTAKFAAGGKRIQKKDLASIAMSYGYIYVAQVAMGADYNQTLKAMLEAESYDGPSLIIAYSPCIEHGIRAGMGSSMHEEAKAVESGYFHLFRFNPALKAEGKSPFVLDSKEPSLSYEEFLEGENRYGLLKRVRPEEAQILFKEASEHARERYEYLKRLSELYQPS